MIASASETPLTARSLDAELAFTRPLHREVCFSLLHEGGSELRDGTISDP